MQAQLIQIHSKPSDYKVCKKCKTINWYENDICSNLECVCESFDESQEKVEEAIKKEYWFWMEEEKYTEEKADSVFYDV